MTVGIGHILVISEQSTKVVGEMTEMITAVARIAEQRMNRAALLKADVEHRLATFLTEGSQLEDCGVDGGIGESADVFGNELRHF